MFTQHDVRIVVRELLGCAARLVTAALLLAAFAAGITDLASNSSDDAAGSRSSLPRPVYDLALLDDGRTIRIEQPGELVIRERFGESSVISPPTRGGVPQSLAGPHRDGRLFVGFADGSVGAFNPVHSEPEWQPIGRHSGPADLLCMSPDGHMLAAGTGGPDGTDSSSATSRVSVLSTTGTREAIQFVVPAELDWVGFSAGSVDLVARTVDGSVSLWDPRTGSPGQRISCGAPGRGSAACSPRGACIAWAGPDDGNRSCVLIRLYDSSNAVRLWEATVPCRSPAGPAYPPRLSFSNDGRLLACGTADAVLLLDAAGGRILATAESLWHRTTAVRFDFNGSHVISAGLDGTVRWWGLPDLAEVGRTQERLLE